jgi:hypothetical protein
MYGQLRDLINPCRDDAFILPPTYQALRQELAVLPLMYDSEGRMYLPPKDDARAKATGQVSIRQLLGRSPDRADSLVLAVHALKSKRRAPLRLSEHVGPQADPGRMARVQAEIDRKVAEFMAKLGI